MSKKETLSVNPVGALVRRLEQDYISGDVKTSKYVIQNPYEDVSTIDAYLNSTHTSGKFDSLEREKPFFNIVIAARNLWYRLTDLDRKNVKIKATKKKEVLGAFIATLFLQDWMRRTNFGQFLNNWGLVLAGYNSAVSKHVEQDGQLYSIVIPWDKLIYDPIDFANNPKIEILEFTPSQLRKKTGYDQKVVDALIKATQSRKTMDRQNKDSGKSDYIRLYEIHGELPLSYLTMNENDADEYVQQMHVISFSAGANKGEYDDFTLVSGKEDKDPYYLSALIPAIDGSVSFDGAVKNLFQAQWMTNHTVKQIKDQLDLASLILFQGSDGNFVGQNALSTLVSGDFLIHASNQPFSQLNNSSHDITQLQNYMTQWRALGQEITSTPDMVMGKTMPSGTAYRQAALVQQEAHDNFEMMTENKGLCTEYIMRTYILPFIKRKMKNNKDEIVATLENAGITKIDTMYVKNEATKRTNDQLIDSLLNDEEVTPESQAQMMAKNQAEVQGEIAGEERFLKPSEIDSKTWGDIIGDLEWDVECEITGESSDKQATMASLTEIFQTIVKMGGRPMTPEEKFVFNKILSESSDVISSVEMQSLDQATQPVAQPAPTNPAVGQVGGAALPANQM
jgi:hypothetical protein